MRGACKSLFGFLGISDPPEETEIAGAVVGPDPGRVAVQRLPRLHDTIERRVLNVDGLQRVVRLPGGFRHDHGDTFADIPDSTDRQAWAWGGGNRRTIGLLDRRAQRQPGEASALPIRTGVDRDNPRRGSGGGGVDAADFGMSVRRSQKGGVKQTGLVGVVDISALTRDKSPILDARHWLTDSKFSECTLLDGIRQRFMLRFHYFSATWERPMRPETCVALSWPAISQSKMAHAYLRVNLPAIGQARRDRIKRTGG